VPERYPLGHLQRWMARVVRHRDTAAVAVRDADELIPERAVLAGEIVAGSANADPLVRLDVYNGGYLFRLRDALKVDFPGLAHALGDAAFLQLVAGYVDAHPSRHPNLNQLGRHLPGFLAARDLQGRAFLHDLARLELAMTQAFDAPAFTPLDMSTLAHVAPEEWNELVLRANPSLRVLAFGHPVNAWLQAFLNEDPQPFPQPAAHWLAVYRKEYQVWRLGLPEPMYRVLGALIEGQPFARALEAGGEHELDLSYWFQQWSADGLFVAVDGLA
jgi:hypothetical protein